MVIRQADIEIVHRKVGSKHVLTSPHVPELHLSHSSKATAYSAVQASLDAIARKRAAVARLLSSQID